MSEVVDLAPYQRRVKELTQVTKDLRAELADEKQARRDERRKLTAQLNEGLSPELLVLRRELTRWRDRAVAAEARLRRTT